jgi:hypothetical protein
MHGLAASELFGVDTIRGKRKQESWYLTPSPSGKNGEDRDGLQFGAFSSEYLQPNRFGGLATILA